MTKKHKRMRQVVQAQPIHQPVKTNLKPWKEVFADPILRLALGFIFIWPVLMFLGNFWYAHRWQYQSYYVQVSGIEQVGDNNKITFEYSGREVPDVILPLTETEGIEAGDWVVAWTKISGTNKEVAVSVEEI